MFVPPDFILVSITEVENIHVYKILKLLIII